MKSIRSTLNDLFASSFARYLSVQPTGLRFPHGLLRSSVPATLLTSRPARTLYKNRKPVCRSLDGIRSIKEETSCTSCADRKACTAQIYLELLVDGIPYKLLLAYTSARNFMHFVSRLRQQEQDLENAEVIISVRDRGRWGEVRFIPKPSAQHNPHP
jgi:hypothetical protein